MRITIKPKDLDLSLTCFPNWVSNGHWAIAKSQIDRAVVYDSEATIKAVYPRLTMVQVHDSDRSIDRLIANGSDALLPWTVTSWRVYRPATRNGSKRDRPEGTYVLCTYGERTAFFDVEYFDLLQLRAGDLIYGPADAKSAFRDKPVNTTDQPVSWILMPVANLITDEEIKQVRGLVQPATMPDAYRLVAAS